MKNVIVAFALLIGFTTVSMAQSSKGKEKKERQKMEMKDGVMMVGDKTMLCSHNKCTPLSSTFTCSDGCKVSSDGTITKPDGSTMKLMNGYQIDQEGKVAMIPHGQQGHVCNASCSAGGKM